MKLITLYLPEDYLKNLELLVEAKLYPNRAEAIRIAIRDLFEFHKVQLREFPNGPKVTVSKQLLDKISADPGIRKQRRNPK
jgi:Arc/MetJ-type ribon-helix-helix transcriptional regulator